MDQNARDAIISSYVDKAIRDGRLDPSHRYQAVKMLYSATGDDETALLTSMDSIFNENFATAQREQAYGEYTEQNQEAIRQVDTQRREAEYNKFITEQYQRYIAQLSKPLDMNDPYVKSVMQGAHNIGDRQAHLRGIEGGISTTHALDRTAQAGMQLEAQRMDRLGQALGIGGSYGQNQQRFREDQNRFDIGIAREDGMRAYEAGRAQHEGVFGLLGGIGGAIVGGSVGGPAGIAPGWSAGSNIGSGIGGMTYGGPPSGYGTSRNYGY